MAYDDNLPGYNTYSRFQIFHIKDPENNEVTVQANWLQRSAARDMAVYGSDREGPYASGKVVDGSVMQGNWRCDPRGRIRQGDPSAENFFAEINVGSWDLELYTLDVKGHLVSVLRIQQYDGSAGDGWLYTQAAQTLREGRIAETSAGIWPS